MRKILSKFVPALFAILLAAGSQVALAGGTTEFGDFQVHYNAIATDDIPPAVATGFGILRSKNRALLNISVTRDSTDPDAKGREPVEAEIRVNASNLTGQLKDVRLRKVVEEGEYQATYYIAEINVADGETLIFDVKIKPSGSEETFQVNFKQQFYTN